MIVRVFDSYKHQKVYIYEQQGGTAMIKAGIIGATGYAGAELARLLLQRDDVELEIGRAHV